MSEACHVLGTMPSVCTHFHNYCPNTLWGRFSVVKLSQSSMISMDCKGSTECTAGAREGQGIAQAAGLGLKGIAFSSLG